MERSPVQPFVAARAHCHVRSGSKFRRFFGATGERAVNHSDLKIAPDWIDMGQEMRDLMAKLYPICRSITGNGVRETLHIIKRLIPLDVHEVPSGTQVFDWVVPKEWNIRDAYVKNSQGERVIDFQKSNLHVVGHSIPVRKRMSLAELRPHLFTLPDHPDWIPYRTSYYTDNWGFCISHNQLMSLVDDQYEVYIDSSLESGSLTYGEYLVPGETSEEILISCHVCHPSLANDNLSGIILQSVLAKHLAQAMQRYSYRFIFIPGTIGSITWLCLNEGRLSNIKHGLVLACVGDRGRSTYKKSRRDSAEIDRAAAHVLKHSGTDYEIIDFFPWGYDERQFCSPGFDLPVGCLMRTPPGRFPEYHTSADNLNFVDPASLSDSLTKCLSIFHVLENNRSFTNQNPKGEPQLGRRGLYQGYLQSGIDEMAMFWVLNLSDGEHTLLEIAERSGIAFLTIKKAADKLIKTDLLKENWR